MQVLMRPRSSAYAQQVSAYSFSLHSNLLQNQQTARKLPHRRLELSRNCFFVGRLPSPSAGSIPAFGHAFLINLGDDIAVAGQQRLCRAHLCTQWELAFSQTIGSVFFKLFLAVVGIRATSAESALVHFSARTEITHLRILRRPE